MRFEIYLSIEGNCFDPVKFNGTLDKSIAGDVIHRQKIGGNRLNSDSALIYWRSTPCEVSDAEYPEDKLLKLVDSLTVDVQDLLKTMSVNVSVNIVEYRMQQILQGECISLLSNKGRRSNKRKCGYGYCPRHDII
ncbi:MAG: hypothetical protein HZT40_01555 [Candidatus Thiothrix singaporensis]|uniref:Uncharacterized protein n=1 Tax=Candidatus Thiothrix singaporensis TaxID=2799669 RepID=A0A7L6AN71_9GAMM|nr:MAG: hypothetical protein HZT40_01555 [Candidatus Thiothrix singaporensis]